MTTATVLTATNLRMVTAHCASDGWLCVETFTRRDPADEWRHKIVRLSPDEARALLPAMTPAIELGETVNRLAEAPREIIDG